jgi:hypothetical protein
MKILTEDSRCLDRDMDPECPEYRSQTASLEQVWLVKVMRECV